MGNIRVLLSSLNYSTWRRFCSLVSLWMGSYLDEWDCRWKNSTLMSFLRLNLVLQRNCQILALQSFKCLFNVHSKQEVHSLAIQAIVDNGLHFPKSNSSPWFAWIQSSELNSNWHQCDKPQTELSPIALSMVNCFRPLHGRPFGLSLLNYYVV